MEWTTIAILVLAGIAGGIVNALAGGATLITFPAMLHVGLPPVIANASNAVAIMPGHLLAAFAGRGSLPRFDRRALILVAVSIAGGAAGAILLLILPERLFILPVPALIAFATLLFAFAPHIQAWATERPHLGLSSQGTKTAVLTVASIYGGFFGAGLGVILTAVLSITEDGDIRTIKAFKNMLATGVSLAATVIFIVEGAVRWQETAVMLSGAIAGGYAGGRLITILPGIWVRRTVILAGTFMFLLYAARYWL